MNECCAFKLWTLPSWFSGYCVYCPICLTLIVKRDEVWRAHV